MKKSKTRIFVDQKITANLIIYIKNEQHHYLKHVMRVKINDLINGCCCLPKRKSLCINNVLRKCINSQHDYYDY